MEEQIKLPSPQLIYNITIFSTAVQPAALPWNLDFLFLNDIHFPYFITFCNSYDSQLKTIGKGQKMQEEICCWYFAQVRCFSITCCSVKTTEVLTWGTVEGVEEGVFNLLIYKRWSQDTVVLNPNSTDNTNRDTGQITFSHCAWDP